LPKDNTKECISEAHPPILRTHTPINTPTKTDLASNERTKKMENIPKNCCGFTSVIDLISKGEWIKPYPIEPLGMQKTIDVLMNSREAKYHMAIDEIIKNSNDILKEKGQMQDPWMILATVQDMIANNSKGEHSQKSFPVYHCPCRPAGNRLWEGNAEFELVAPDSYRLTGPQC
jgi:hypothetical protein